MPTIHEKLSTFYPNRVQVAHSADDLPESGYMVYVLVWNGRSIVTGHGKKNRAKVIFDDLDHKPTVHIKALIVRIHHLFGGAFRVLERYYIPCANKTEAEVIETIAHDLIGGNTLKIDPYLEVQLFDNLSPADRPHLLLRIALASSYDGLSDLRGWKKKGILDHPTWAVISQRLKL
jgi:hypothetical protein